MDSRARFEALYRAHCGSVRSFVHRRVRPAVADDVVADVFVLAWRQLENAPGDELPWLLGIARGVLANRRRGEARQQALRDRLAASTVAGVQPVPGGFDGESEALMRALGCLNRLDQEVLLLVAWDGLDRVQAARVLGITPGLFSVRLHRARRRLARLLTSQEREIEQGGGNTTAMEVSFDER
ncbi:MAG: RNA polymerase sigma factor [Solirubrobacteraceae bacterium]